MRLCKWRHRRPNMSTSVRNQILAAFAAPRPSIPHGIKGLKSGSLMNADAPWARKKNARLLGAAASCDSSSPMPGNQKSDWSCELLGLTQTTPATVRLPNAR